ncbi:hypothetical protein KUTeg_015256 [Tegillarca granosa]|uniref:Major facilitator superfamily (MFS) profile domain-containing protein n=1 Tax=Tegillarca granosa TaxID=220873 RepID=A0ABQ9ET82_TEGGR|nr:hypothetical protein KUTeg_015256 [Tegillarca granosa]
MIVGGIISTTRITHTICGIDVIFSDYRIAFYIFTGCMGLTFISAWFFEFECGRENRNKPVEMDETEENKRIKPAPDVLVAFRLFMSVHYGSWLVCIFFVGVCNGVIWGFLNWHLENIGASQFLIGCAVIINNISEVIMFFVVFPILERIGYFTFMVLGVIGYVARFCVFASLTNPWFVLPVEILQGFTFAGIWGAMIGYLCTVIPGENMATMQGILHGVYWGLGSGSGSMIGGIVTEHFGARVTFWSFAVATVFNLIIFVITQKLAAKPKRKYEEIDN